MDGSEPVGVDTGTAYGLKPASYNRNLVEVGPGTPMGELMRRYWHPCFTSADLTSERPERVRLLGEDLILFRDKEGRPGLVHEHCCHRGTSLFYGRIEDDGIRCCYHGWKFDVKGRCLDQPAEVDGGRNRARIRQPWYPVEERYGLVYAYMGPPEKKPVLPRWKHLEDLGPGEILDVRWKPSAGVLDDSPGAYKMNPVPYNWLSVYENTTDGPHFPWLHYHHSGYQSPIPSEQRASSSDAQLREKPAEPPPFLVDIKNLVERLVAERTALGIKSGFLATMPNGTSQFFGNETIIPNAAILGGVVDMYYIVPVDDTHFASFLLWRSKFKGEFSNFEFQHNGKTWWEMSPEEHQRYPDDYEAQSSIGMPAHSREHLSQGDVGLSMLRRRLEEAVRDVAEGRDPPNVSFDTNAPPIQIADI